MEIEIGQLTIKIEDIIDLNFLEFAEGERSIVRLARNNDTPRMRESDIHQREFALDYASSNSYQRHYAETVANLPEDAFTRSEADVPLWRVIGINVPRPPHELDTDTQVRVINFRAIWWQNWMDEMQDIE